MIMRIAVEALGIHYVGGGRSATLNLLEALFQIDQQNQYLVILTAPEHTLSGFDNVTQLIAPVRNRLLVRIWAQLRLPRIVQSYDLIHFVKNLSVFGISIPRIVTVYDLTTLVYPQIFPTVDVLYWRHVQPLALRRADVIIAISAETANDLRRFFPVPDEKIRVIYPGYARVFTAPSLATTAAVLRKYNLPNEFVLQVGRLDRKKNLAVLIQAYAMLKREFGFGGKLVLVGEEYHKMRDRDVHRAIRDARLEADVIQTGAVPLEDLPALYGGATLAVYLSMHEGFGIVAVEAMACGAPLIASRTGAIPEAAGDAAVYVDAAVDPGRLAAEMWRVVSSEQIRAQMRAAGFRQAARFSNERCALDTLLLYNEVAKQSRSEMVRTG